MKKFLALLLIFATLVSLLVACAETDPVEQVPQLYSPLASSIASQWYSAIAE